MPWKEQSRMSSRLEFLQQATAEGANIAELCRQHQITRATGYKWIARYRQQGGQALGEQSRRPHSSPQQTPRAIVEEILALRGEHPSWGARKLRKRLLVLNPQREDLPALSTITEILRRNRMLDADVLKKHQHYQRFERAEANELWQMDFKGDFPLSNQQRCYPLGVVDDHSRFLLGLLAAENMQSTTVEGQLTSIFRSYGLPERMLMDNGSPWGNSHEHPHTHLTAWLMRLGIAISHGRAYHPQTQGKQERFHRTLGEDVLAGRTFSDHAEVQRAFDAWRQVYNEQRPHQAIELAVPAEHYRPSPRLFPEILPPIEYPAQMQLRRVQQHGRISFQGRTLRVGRPFVGYPVGLQPSDTDGIWNVFFCQFMVTTLDLRQA
jgi:transposase InsO family protein